MRKIYLVIALLVSSFLGSALPASAGESDNVSGWAWSSNIGWISFNCTDGSTCDGVDYGVHKDASGNLTGYAWSSNIGWIQFGGLSGFPSGNGTQAVNARVSGNNLQGWAKALSASGSDGWDGWISLSGSGYGVNKSGDNYTGFAWGDEVVGWTRFDPPSCDGCGVTEGGGTPAVSLNVTPSGTVPYGSNVTISYDLAYFPDGESCTLSGSPLSSNPNPITASGSRTTGSITTPGTYDYTITCTNGLSDNASFEVDDPVTGITLTPANGSEYINIRFNADEPTDSEVKTIYINTFGLSGTIDVTIDLAGLSGDWQGATVLVSLDGGPFMENPDPLVISCNTSVVQCASFTVQTNVSNQIQTTSSGPGLVIEATPSGGGTGESADLFLRSSVIPVFEEF